MENQFIILRYVNKQYGTYVFEMTSSGTWTPEYGKNVDAPVNGQTEDYIKIPVIFRSDLSTLGTQGLTYFDTIGNPEIVVGVSHSRIGTSGTSGSAGTSGSSGTAGTSGSSGTAGTSGSSGTTCLLYKSDATDE